ncbi:tRNA-splicing endonuclease subunit Sen15 [Chanos chanos]|uniref:tRNA-splicing endonuclease subunit Sen15 n=1 Tax=Chanos chanos TaxID=29144 RepID=A0A6J2VER4_CHACN|nr:tRNA-splicing endonuclease subunit Sen15 [Chanos chanos]
MTEETVKTMPNNEDGASPPNWMLQHPMYQDLMRLDVGDCAQVYTAFLVYLDLTEGRQWTEVNGVACPELEAVLLEGREKDDAPIQTVYPLPAHRSISHKGLRCVLNRGAATLLCAVASDSSLVYQRLCDGLLTPDPPVGIQDQGRRQHRKRRIQP